LHVSGFFCNDTSMYQKIIEPIDVIGVYKKHKFIPKRFKWKNRIFNIDSLTMVSNVRDGNIKKRLYSAVAGGNVYRLEFNRENEQWMLLEVWVE
jgi:hypothetical protein